MSKEGKLPPGYKSVKDSGTVIQMTKEDLPWLTESTNVRLAEVELVGGQRFLLGSVVFGYLRKIADKLLSHKHEGGDKVNDTFYTQISEMITHGSISMPRLQQGIGSEPIYYTKSKGIRTYFIRTKKDGVDTIIKIAACAKVDEGDVYGKITK